MSPFRRGDDVYQEVRCATGTKKVPAVNPWKMGATMRAATFLADIYARRATPTNVLKVGESAAGRKKSFSMFVVIPQTITAMGLDVCEKIIN